MDALYAAAIAGDADAIAKLAMEADILNKNGETILHLESENGNTERVRFILKKFEHKNLLVKPSKFKDTALHVAAYFGHTEVAVVLIDAATHLPVTSFQAFLRQADKFKKTALHRAVEKRHASIVKLLVEADPSDTHIQNDDGKTPMYIAVEEGYNDIAEIISKTCTAPSLDGPHGRTALHAAILNAHEGDSDVIMMMLNAARRLPVTSFQAFLRQADHQNLNTALHRAVMGGKVDIVKLLVEADPSDTHIQNHRGKTPMYIAVEKGFNHIVEIISTTCTAPSNLDGPYGSTALHAAILNDHEEGASKIIMMMLNAAKRASIVNFEALFSKTDVSGSTVLQLAVQRNYVDVVKLILQEDPAYQPGRQIKRNGLMRLIYEAIDNKYSDEMIDLLSETYEAGINPDHKDVLALILSIKRRDEDSVLGHLRDAKNLVSFKEDNGWTPLHYAVYHEFDSVLGAIIEAQEEVGDPFVYEDKVLTPFHVAFKHGYTSTMIKLMQSWPPLSSTVTVVDEIGRNILHLAADNKNKEMVRVILKYCPEKYKNKILKHQDNNGDTPLHLLISHGCFIRELITHKVLDTMPKNKNNYTPHDMLYFKNDVVADQVHIKIALDDVLHTNQSSWNLWAKSTEKKTDINWNIITPSKRRMKDMIFDEQKKKVMDEKHEQMKKDLETYKMRTNTQILVTALITTVTFTVGFSMPGGLHQSGEVDEGLVVLSRKRAFNVFMVSDALALLMSTLSLFFYFLESMNEDPRQVSILNASSTVLNILSVMAMMLTFITGTYVVLSDSPVLAIGVCIIGSLFFLLIIIIWIIKKIDDRRVKKNKD